MYCLFCRLGVLFKAGYLTQNLLQKRIRVRCSAQQLLQNIKDLLRSTILQNGVSVPDTSFHIHRVRLEMSIVNVRGENLRVQVAIVTRLISSRDVAKSRVSSVVDTSIGDQGNLFSQLVPQFGQVKRIDFLLRVDGVETHVEKSKVQLSQVEQTCVHMLGLDQLVDQLVRNRLGSFKVRRQCLEFVGRPRPELQHLRWTFDKVSWNTSSMETGVFGLGQQTVDAVAQLMEESCHFVVFQQRWLCLCWFGEVTNQSRVSSLSCAI